METKVVLITGGSRGIGAAIANRLSRDFSTIIINYRSNRSAAENLKQKIENRPDFKGTVELIACDVSDYEQCTAMIQSIVNKFGKIDILVNNAGISKGGFLMTSSLENWWDIVHTNLGSVVNCSKAAIPHFIKQKYGKIINISSASGIRGTAGNSDYSAAKAGVIGFTKAMARELVNFGIIVNSIAPGFIDTDMVQQMPDKQKERIKEMVPMKRMGHVDEVAEVTALLSSDKANYILGQTIVIDGGITM